MKRLIFILSILLFIIPSLAESVMHDGYPADTGYILNAKLVAGDPDGDGKLEILAAPENRMIKVFNTTGWLVWENVSGTVYAGDTARVPVVRNLSGDAFPEVLTYGNPGLSDPTFYIWDKYGRKVTEMMVGRALVPASPSVTNEGFIITAVRKGRSSGIINGTGVHAFDNEGNRLWYLELGMNATTSASIPVVDLDEDGLDEAVVLTEDNLGIGMVWAIKLNRTQGTVLWSKPLGGDAWRVAAGDLNNDGRNEIVVLSTGGVYIFDRNGNEQYRFDIDTRLSAAPAIGDLDRNGINEVVFASHYNKKMYIISNGVTRDFSINGNPTGSIGRVDSNVALGDLNGDGKLEIAAGDIANNVYVWDYNGTLIDSKYINEVSYYISSALIKDLEKNGNRELILGHDSGKIYVYTYLNPGDSTPPVTSDYVSASWYNSSVNILLNASDAQSGVFNTYYTTDGTLPTTDSRKGNIINLDENGIFTIKYFSVDRAENAEDVRTSANQAKVDTIPPSSLDDADNKWLSGVGSMNITVSDNLSGVAFLHYRVDGMDNISSGDVNLVFTEEGVHTVEYYGEDIAGNIESQKNASVKLDMSPPSTTDNSNAQWQNNSFTLWLSGTDNLSGVNTTYYKVTSVPLSMLASFVSFVSGVLGLAPGYTEGDNVTFSDEGVYTVSYFSIDNVGNMEPEKISQQVRIDKTLPTITVTVPQNRTYSQYESITLDFSAQDALSGIMTMSASIDGIRQVSSGDVIDMSTLNPGGHVFYYEAVDNAGNLQSQTVPFSVSGTIIPGTGFINGTVKSGDSPVSEALVSTTGGSTTTDTNGNYSLPLQSGTYSVTVSKQPEYVGAMVTGISVTDGYATKQDFVLTLKPKGNISGVVRNI